LDSALTNSAILIFLIILGFALKRGGMFQQSDSKILSKIMLNVTLPAVLVNAFRDFTLDLRLLSFIFIALAVNLLLVLIGWLAGGRETPRTRAMYILCLSCFNIGNFAIPFIQYLFPEHILEAVMFDVGNSVFNCGLSYSFAAMQLDSGSRFSPKAMIKNLFSTPIFDIYLVIFGLSVCRVRLPDMVYQLADTVAGANAVVVMLMLGILFEVRLSQSARRQVAKILSIRVLCGAVIGGALFLFLPFPLEQRVVAAMLVCAPISGMTTVFCEKLDCDPNVYGTATSLTIPISIAVMVGLAML